MPYKYRKDESSLVDKWLIKADKKHYFHVFLWDSQESFNKNTVDNIPFEFSGCVNLAPTIIEIDKDFEREIVRPKLGEVHFIKDKWTLEIVAHELCHAMFHRLRMMKNPTAEQIMEQDNSSEEDICYEFGRWVDQIYRFLWSANRNKNWKEKHDKTINPKRDRPDGGPEIPHEKNRSRRPGSTDS